MNFANYWNQQKYSLSPSVQVQRISSNEFKIFSERICEILKIKESDEVLDVCCGNGFITNIISKKCSKIIGVDFSEQLIEFATKNNSSDNTEYKVLDVLNLNQFIQQKFDKIYIEFSFQYFTTFEKGKALIEILLQKLNSGGMIYIGNIPDFSKRWNLYNTNLKKLFYVKSIIFDTNPNGKFWKEGELKKICKILSCNGQLIKQPSQLPYAHYRFDYLITKI